MVEGYKIQQNLKETTVLFEVNHDINLASTKIMREWLRKCYKRKFKMIFLTINGTDKATKWRQQDS